MSWELTRVLEPEDEVLLIPLCPRCVAGMETTHSARNVPDWPDEPEGFRADSDSKMSTRSAPGRAVESCRKDQSACHSHRTALNSSHSATGEAQIFPTTPF